MTRFARLRRHPSFFLGVMALALGPGFFAAASANPFAYVPYEGSGTLSVIDPATDRRVADIAVGKLPWGVAIR